MSVNGAALDFRPLDNESSNEPFLLKTEDWNRIVDFMHARALLALSGYPGATGPPHPWRIRCEWSPDLEQFVFSIAPGFVRGLAPLAQTYDSLTNPDNRKRRGIKEEIDPSSKVRVEVPITDLPLIPITNNMWRDVVTSRSVDMEGVPSRAVPQDLQERMNILLPKKGSASLLGGLRIDSSDQDAQDKKTARLLKCMEVFVRVARPHIALTSEVGGSDIRYLESYVQYTEARNDPPVIWVTNRNPLEVEAMTNVTIRQALELGDDAYDAMHIATIWLCSPPGEIYDDEINENWLPVPDYTTFYNLDYTIQARTLAVPPLRVINPAWALGLSGVLVEPAVQAMNALNAQATELYNSVSIAGKFWTV